MLFLAVNIVARAQTSSDASWNARMAALDEERAAQAGVAASIVFDDSGSMNDRDKIGSAKRAFQSWIESAPPGYRFGLTALNSGRLVELKRDNKAEILAAVSHLRAAGGTPLADAIARVGADIRKRRAAGALYERQVLVVLTDGEDSTNRGARGVQEELERLRRENVEVVALGFQGEGNYLRAAATHFFSPENAADIRRGLDVIAAEIGDPADLVVDGPTRERMQRITATSPVAAAPAPTTAPDAVAAAQVTPAPTTTPAPPARRNRAFSGRHTTFIFVLILAFFFVRALVRRSSKR